MTSGFKVIALVLTVFSGLTISPYALADSLDKNPTPITRTTISKSGNELIITEVLIDKTTSREDLIHTCKFLADEGVLLTFEDLYIRRPFLGILGKPRISQAKGRIQLPNGSSEEFEAGGAISFHSINITYSLNSATDEFTINTVEIID